MQFNYHEALNVIREKQISWVVYFYNNYGVDISNAIISYQDQLIPAVNNADRNIMKLEDYITGIARRIEGAQESLKISIGSNCANMISKAKKTAEFTIGENGVDPVKFIKDVVDQFKQSPVNTTKDDVSLKPSDGDDSKKVYITETYCFDKDVILLTFNKYGEWQEKVYHITEDDLLVHKGHISKVTRVYK